MNAKTCDEELQDALKHSERLEREMSRLRQEVNAMQCILDGLVMTNSHPSELLQLWRILQPGLVDGLMKPQRDGEPAHAPELAGWREVMHRYTHMLEFALNAHSANNEKSDVRS